SAAPSVSAPPSFAEASAVACGGYPAVGRIIALLRRNQVVPASSALTASIGPLCAGGWQYTVFTSAGREPLQVVTQGAPASLTLVTAGTDVCTPLVQTQAPAGILAATHC
ncbi:MAG TPA: hypothetical protein VJT31_23335, partial [Rugosimonospora sp.]|nr:hypothetical protein [Rugosimonospora sp.]